MAIEKKHFRLHCLLDCRAGFAARNDGLPRNGWMDVIARLQAEALVIA